MTMREIERNGRNVVRELNHSTSDAVKRYFTTSTPIPEDVAEEALRVWDRLRERELWLECDCRPGHNPRPRLYAAEPGQIRRFPNNGKNTPHSPDCVFSRRGSSAAREILPVREVRQDGEFAIHGAFSEPGRNGSSSSATATGGKRRNSLASILFNICEKSEVSSLGHGLQVGPQTHAKYVDEWASVQTMCRDAITRISLGEMLVCAGGYSVGIERLKKLRETLLNIETWPSGGRPHGYLIGVVSDFSENKEKGWYELSFIGWKQPQRLDARPHVFAEGSNRNRSPYLAIVSLAHPDRSSDKIHGIRCYMQPCLSETNWFPVDSGLERETVRILQEWRESLPDEVTADITKPLFDTMTDDGKACRPDFLLTIRLKGNFVQTIAVETMGSISIAYEESKKITHPRMRQIWKHLAIHDLTISSSRARMAAQADLIKALDAIIATVNLRRKQ